LREKNEAQDAPCRQDFGGDAVKKSAELKYYFIMHPEIYKEIMPVLDKWYGKQRWFWIPVLIIYGILLNISDWITGNKE